MWGSATFLCKDDRCKKYQPKNEFCHSYLRRGEVQIPFDYLPEIQESQLTIGSKIHGSDDVK